ncbi:sialic acid-binding Ig-like lectin 13 [Paramisgurnus dabryanus]|uniref:sialic acid-binding Ig-like lectin 13 n=1 Tax=Paramisgurnus dabryanus TaxID=90735 RepID=UPI0031F47822
MFGHFCICISVKLSCFEMARIQINFCIIIIISFVLTHTHSADGDVYSAVLPHTVTALTDSCVLIPCTFNISTFEEKLQKTKQIYWIWLKKTPLFGKDESSVVFNSSKNIIQGFRHIEMIGNLTERNCSTVFYNIMMNHSDPYYFRIEMEPNVFRATFNTNKQDSRKTVRINVTDSPQPPELKFSPNVSKSVMEGTAVNLICSAEAPCPKQPPTLSWTNIPKSANIITQLQEKPDKTHSVFSSMTFNASYMDHRMNISCTVTYPRNISNNITVNSTVMLRVSFPPKETHIIIKPSASVTVGTNVTFTCKSKGNPSSNMTYTWYKRGQETPLAQEKKMSFIVTHNNTGWYFCTALNKHGNQSSEEIELLISGSLNAAMYGCIGGLLALLVISAVFYYMRTKTLSQTNTRKKDQTEDKSKELDIYSNKTIEINMKSEISEKETDEVHYGEIDFSTPHIDHINKINPETEYAEIQRKTQINSVQKQEELYAQIKIN